MLKLPLWNEYSVTEPVDSAQCFTFGLCNMSVVPAPHSAVKLPNLMLMNTERKNKY